MGTDRPPSGFSVIRSIVIRNVYCHSRRGGEDGATFYKLDFDVGPRKTTPNTRCVPLNASTFHDMLYALFRAKVNALGNTQFLRPLCFRPESCSKRNTTAVADEICA